MRRNTFLLILVLLTLAFTGIYTVRFAQANPFGQPNTFGITVLSPQNASYSPDRVLLSFGVVWYGASCDAWYTLDNQTAVQATLSSHSGSAHVGEFNLSIVGLHDGSHVIKVVASNGYSSKEKQVTFTVDSKPPQVTINLPANKSYSQASIPLNFTISENATSITYSFDGQQNRTYNQNATISGLLAGNHNLTAYAWDTAGNVGASETTYFVVASPKSFPTTTVSATVVGAVAVAAGLLVYQKKRKRQQTS
jgi:hypothetical protein